MQKCAATYVLCLLGASWTIEYRDKMCHAVAFWYRSTGELSPEDVANRCTALALAMVGAEDRHP